MIYAGRLICLALDTQGFICLECSDGTVMLEEGWTEAKEWHHIIIYIYIY